MLAVHLRFSDGVTKKPLPVRLRIEGPRGETYSPLGRMPVFPCGKGELFGGHLRIDGENWWHIDGACEVTLPAGVPLRIRASHGIEYEPFDRTVTLGPGQMALRFDLSRWFDRHAEGWIAADGRSHLQSPHDALLEAAAEDLDIVNLLACETAVHAADGHTYSTISNIAAFSGQSPALERDGRAVVVNTFNRHAMLGRVALLNSHRPVFPFRAGGDEPDDWTLADWIGQCHRKGGLAVRVDAFRAESGLVGGEGLIAALLGEMDAIEIDPEPRMQWVYRLWNAGVRLPLVGSSGKESHRVPLGAMRTYAKAEGRDYGSWIAAVKAGRTFVTNGPILYPFDTAHLVAESIVPFESLEIVANGKVAASASAVQSGNRWQAELDASAVVPSSGWWAVRCRGKTAFAHSSPVSVSAEAIDDPSGRAALIECLETTLAWTRAEARFVTEKAREKLLERGQRARAVLAQI